MTHKLAAVEDPRDDAGNKGCTIELGQVSWQRDEGVGDGTVLIDHICGAMTEMRDGREKEEGREGRDRVERQTETEKEGREKDIHLCSLLFREESQHLY
jgi:hypothetical protein